MIRIDTDVLARRRGCADAPAGDGQQGKELEGQRNGSGKGQGEIETALIKDWEAEGRPVDDDRSGLDLGHRFLLRVKVRRLLQSLASWPPSSGMS